jgi:FAD:protein FMN transferase
VMGPATERVYLRAAATSADPVAVVGLANGSLASSSGVEERRDPARFPGLHVHGAHRRRVGSRTFVCVMAEQCVIADALTKVVLGTRSRGAAILRQYGATAHVYTARSGWHTVGVAP